MTQTPPTLIPRQALFGNPSRQSPTISPDGRHLAWLAPLSGGPIQAYTPFAKTRVQVVKISHRSPEAILISINNRDPRWHDVHRLDLASGALTLVWENPGGYERIVTDLDLNPVLAQRPTDDGGFVMERFAEDGSLSELFACGLEDGLTTGVIGVMADGDVLMLDSRGRDKVALAVADRQTGAVRALAEDARADVQSALRHPMTGAPLAVGVEYLEHTWRALGPELAEDIAFLNQAAGDWRRLSHTDDDRYWTLVVDPVTSPPAYHLYDRQTRQISLLFTSRPELEDAALSPMHPVEIVARDGLKLVSYLTLPPECGAAERPEQPLPLVLYVHGGPWARDIKGFNPTHQWLAGRGYAVLSVNYRASTGFGKAFVNAGDLQWGRAMHDDLLDAMEWAITVGITARDRVAIMGGSYGGYATLAGLTMTPEVFVCGVDIVGPSNLFTLLETIPPYWQAVFHQFAKRMGDPHTEEGRALLKERSPLTYVDSIARPLLIGQGANDPRVNQRESDQVVAAMKAKNIPVTYVLYPDEGHGFARPENRLSFYAIAEAFLAECLGGAYEPVGEDFQGSSLQILEGAAHVPGLPASVVTG